MQGQYSQGVIWAVEHSVWVYTKKSPLFPSSWSVRESGCFSRCELSTINSSSTSEKYETRCCASRSSWRSVVESDSSFLCSNCCAWDGQETGPIAWCACEYASCRSTALMRRKVGVLDEFSAELWSDNQLYCGASSANVAHAQKYDTRPKMDAIDPKIDVNWSSETWNVARSLVRSSRTSFCWFLR